MKRHFDAIVREETDRGCVIYKHTKMMKPDEANRIKMRALYESLFLTELSLADEAVAADREVLQPNNPKADRRQWLSNSGRRMAA